MPEPDAPDELPALPPAGLPGALGEAEPLPDVEDPPALPPVALLPPAPLGLPLGELPPLVRGLLP